MNCRTRGNLNCERKYKQFKLKHNNFLVRGDTHLTKKQIEGTKEIMNGLSTKLSISQIKAVLTYLDQEVVLLSNN